ncbi:MAG TPA: class I adenylate-forming enzyme family protein [Solirubrobacteraceae bacterium]|nr:class I adenylate-forming enzyme family protein [Solirubrobacteraceae bacterium]
MPVHAGMPAIDAAASFSECVALRDKRSTMTFAELDRGANRVAGGLAAFGIGGGERVAVLAQNRSEVVELWLACERAAFVRVVLHSHFDMTMHRETLRSSGAAVLVFDARFADAVAEQRHELEDVRLFVAIGGKGLDWAVGFDELRERGSEDFALVEIDEDAPFCIQPTTGTTGAPKPWLVTHRGWRALIAHNLMHLDALGPTPVAGDDVNLHVHALQWASGAQTLLPYMLRGAETVLLDDAAFDPNEIVAAIHRYGVTGLLLPAPMLTPVLDVIEAHPSLEHRIRRLVTLFATPELLERTTRVLGPVWCHAYGSTEQGAPVTRLAAGEVAEAGRIASVGRKASPFVELAIMDDAGSFLPSGAVGEIVVRSPMSSSSYWQDRELTDAAFYPGEWFRSRDLGYLDEHGFLFYVDRANDAILTAEGTVYPHEVEAAVMAHPAVANCGVVGLGDAGTQKLVAAVLLKEDVERSADLGDEIEASVAGSLDERARPEIVFVEDLPTVLGGAKVQRDPLRTQLMGERIS